jgi:hypothetical protein
MVLIVDRGIEENNGHHVRWTSTSDKHFIHDRSLTMEVMDTNSRSYLTNVRYLRLHIDTNATPWGSSLWRIELYGHCT